MGAGGGRGRRLLLGAAALGAVLVVAGTAGVPPAPTVRELLPAGVGDRVTLVGVALLGLVATAVAMFVVLKATVFVLRVAVAGREALAELPDVDPLIGGAVGVGLLVAVSLSGAAVLTGGVGGSNLPYVEEALGDGPPEDAHGVVAGDELAGTSYTDRELPEYADADGDRLPDAWERAGETPDGAPLPGADPNRKDLYVQVNYAGGAEPLTDAEKRQLRRIWAEMPVENPDGTTGIRVHVVDEPPRGGPVETEAVVGPDGPDREFVERYYAPEYMGPRRCSHYLVVFGEVSDPYAGWGLTPGYFSVVDGGGLEVSGNSTARVRTTTHELLHNVVGTTPEGSHVDRGWLADDAERFEPAMSPATSGTLNASGFARSAPMEFALCDRPVGAPPTSEDG